MAVLIESQLAQMFLITAMMIGEETAGARICPFHRAIECPRTMQGANIFGKHRALQTKGSADIIGNEMHVIRRDAEHFSKKDF